MSQDIGKQHSSNHSDRQDAATKLVDGEDSELVALGDGARGNLGAIGDVLRS